MRQAVRTDARRSTAPDYSKNPNGPLEHALAFMVGFAAGFVVLFIFYKLPVLAAIGGLLTGAVNIFSSANEKQCSENETGTL